MKSIHCKECRLHTLPLFTPQSDTELALIESLKKEQVVVDADRTVIHEDQSDALLYTLLSGWAFRFKTLSDGRRQILNFLLPGDFIGVQQKMGDATALVHTRSSPKSHPLVVANARHITSHGCALRLDRQLLARCSGARAR